MFCADYISAFLFHGLLSLGKDFTLQSRYKPKLAFYLFFYIIKAYVILLVASLQARQELIEWAKKKISF